MISESWQESAQFVAVVEISRPHKLIHTIAMIATQRYTQTVCYRGYSGAPMSIQDIIVQH